MRFKLKSAQHANLKFIVSRCFDIKSEYVADAGIGSLTKGCSHLTSINIPSCTQLTDASLPPIGARCMELTNIDMSDDKNVTDAGIAILTEGCSHLQSIKIGRCFLLTDASLTSVGGN